VNYANSYKCDQSSEENVRKYVKKALPNDERSQAILIAGGAFPFLVKDFSEILLLCGDSLIRSSRSAVSGCSV
jgi:hypothetical protein